MSDHNGQHANCRACGTNPRGKPDPKVEHVLDLLADSEPCDPTLDDEQLAVYEATVRKRLRRDHFAIVADAFKANPSADPKRIAAAIRSAIDAGRPKHTPEPVNPATRMGRWDGPDNRGSLDVGQAKERIASIRASLKKAEIA